MTIRNLFFIPSYREITCESGRYPSYWLLKELDQNRRFRTYCITKRISNHNCFKNINFMTTGYIGSADIQVPKYNYNIYKMYKRVEDKVNIIHHCEFFQVGKGYNLIPILSNIKDKSFLIGPVELPHKVFESDYLAGSSGIGKYIKKCAYINRDIMRLMFKALFKRTIESADTIIVPDSSIKKELSKYIDKDQIELINYGVDMSLYNKYQYTATEDNYDIIFAGNASERKGVRYLLEAISIIKEDFPDVKLHLRTRGHKLQEYREISKNFGIEERVFYHKMEGIDRYLEQLSRSRLLCLPTLSEGYG